MNYLDASFTIGQETNEFPSYFPTSIKQMKPKKKKFVKEPVKEVRLGGKTALSSSFNYSSREAVLISD